MNSSNTPEPEGWHLDKRIPIATLLSMLGLVVVGTLHLAEMRKDIEVLRQEQTALSNRVTKQDADNIRAFDRFYSELREMNSKLDRLIQNGK